MSAAAGVVIIVRLRDGADEAACAEVLTTLRLAVDGPRWRRFGAHLVVAWPDDIAAGAVERLADDPRVDRALVLAAGERLSDHWPDDGPYAIPLGRGLVGGDEPVLIAGPCTVESEGQLMETADGVKSAGAHALRGGAFKPRTSPYSFGGLGVRGVELLAAARQRTGLPVVSEALEREQLDLLGRSVDVFQVGSRNMHNASLLFQAGADPSGLPILLKRGFGATVDELLDAAEYALLGRLDAGHDAPGVMLCERGIRSFETSTRFSLDPGVIGVIRSRSKLPVLVDPSHAAGSRELVVPLGRAALAAGAHGLIVEVHLDPDRAWCDGQHAVGLEQLEELNDAQRSQP